MRISRHLLEADGVVAWLRWTATDAAIATLEDLGLDFTYDGPWLILADGAVPIGWWVGFSEEDLRD